MTLEEAKQAARDLLQDVRLGESNAVSRLRRAHSRWTNVDEAKLRQQVCLHDARVVVASEQGLADWDELEAEAGRPLGPPWTHIIVPDMDWLDERAKGLVRIRRSGTPQALEQIREWHPRFMSATDEEILDAPFDESDARLVYAREHGAESWEDLGAKVAELRRGTLTDPFLSAYQSMKAADLEGLKSILRTHPHLIRARGTNGNTILNLASSLAGSALCATAPPALREAALTGIDALLAAGADPDQPNDRGWTPLHQAAYANQPVLAERFLAAGASLDAEAHGAGGTPLVVALFWGHREVAATLAERGLSPLNLRAAAGIGDISRIDSFFGASGALSDRAGVARGFYRPHSGFPDWSPATDPQEVLDEALVWACKSDRVEVLEHLLARGARIDADPYRGTPLIWAAFCNRPRAVAWLLDHGAEIDRRATFGGPSHGQGVTALHLAAQSGRMAVVELLVARGADRAIEDDLYHGTPAGWAEHEGRTEVRDYLTKCS